MCVYLLNIFIYIHVHMNFLEYRHTGIHIRFTQSPYYLFFAQWVRIFIKRIPFQLYRLSKCTNTLHCSGLLHLLSAMYMYVPVLRVYDTPLSVLNIDIRSQTKPIKAEQTQSPKYTKWTTIVLLLVYQKEATQQPSVVLFRRASSARRRR